MGMSTHIEFRRNLETDKEYKKQLNVIKVCEEAGVSIPAETLAYFEWDNGWEPDLDEIKDHHEVIFEEGTFGMSSIVDVDFVDMFRDEGREGFEVNVDKLPKDCKIIRFYNSY